jgi:hypothetical protein
VKAIEQMVRRQPHWDKALSSALRRTTLAALLAIPLTSATAGTLEASAHGEWAQLEIVDVADQPWDANSPYGRIKTVFNKEQSNLKFIEFPPTLGTGLPERGEPGNEVGPHYHLFSEWAYLLSGDYVLYEPVSPYQRNPVQHRWIEGTWMDRPPFSLHSGDWATGGIRAQNPSTLILFEEGTRSISLNPKGNMPPVLDADPSPDVADYRSISFKPPLIVNTGSALEWEKDTQVEGRLVKWLSDDPEGGFRAQLVKVPPGWSHPDGANMSYFESAHRLRYLLYGDLTIALHAGPENDGEPKRLEKADFVYQPPHSLWAYDTGPVTENGAVWLEITYANGLARSAGPIEKVKHISESN